VENLPEVQVKQVDPEVENKPAAHDMQTMAPASADWPALHTMHALLADPLWNMPTEQFEQIGRPVEAPNLPGGHLFAAVDPDGQ